MGIGARIGDTLRVPGRGLRRSTAVLVVLAIAAAIGGAVSLTAPALMSGLGLAGQPPRAPRRPSRLRYSARCAPTPRIRRPPASPRCSTRSRGASALRRFSGVVLDPATGAALWGRAPETPMVPGSAGKLLTAAAALLTLDPTDRLTTGVLAGPDPETVVLVGGGDPTLSALPPGRDGLYPGAPKLADLAAEVKAAQPGPHQAGAGRRLPLPRPHAGARAGRPPTCPAASSRRSSR